MKESHVWPHDAFPSKKARPLECQVIDLLYQARDGKTTLLRNIAEQKRILNGKIEQRDKIFRKEIPWSCWESFSADKGWKTADFCSDGKFN